MFHVSYTGFRCGTSLERLEVGSEGREGRVKNALMRWSSGFLDGLDRF